MVNDAVSRGFAVPSFCVWNAEVMETVFKVAARLNAPVIVMNGPGEFPLIPPASMAAIARGLEQRYTVTAALHLDHGDSLELVFDCIEAGYTSVMLDFSDQSFEKNSQALKQVVSVARAKGTSVEGELGRIGRGDKINTEGAKESIFTDPEQAACYVAETNIDIFAPSVGNMHGNYREKPRLDFELIAKTRKAVGIPLALHGGTGIPKEVLKRGIACGIAKVNIATELIQTVRDSLRRQWKADKNLWLPLALAEAMRDLEPVIEKWIMNTGAIGKV